MVLHSRKAVCEGFSNLYFALGEAAGLDIKKVSGYAKGYSYTPGMRFKDINHAWNIIRINGNYRVFDATWGQGSGKTIDGKLVSGKEFDAFWFNVDPYVAIFSHLPENNEPAYVHPALDLKAFEVLPSPDDAYFELGFISRKTYKKAISDRAATFPTCYKVGTFIKMRAAPSQGVLQKNQEYTFEFYIPRGLSVALVDARNNWTYLQGQKGVFSLTYTPAQIGELSVCLQYDSGGVSFQTFLEYTVQEGEAVL